VDAAYRWLMGGGTAPAIEVTVPGRSTAGGWVVAGSGAPRSGTQRFELRSRPAAAPVTYTLRSDAPWLTGPRTVTLVGGVTTVELRYQARELAAPGAYTAVVSGWPADTVAGPGFRLVTTVVVPAAVADTTIALRQSAPVGVGEALRSFFTPVEEGVPEFSIRVVRKCQVEEFPIFGILRLNYKGCHIKKLSPVGPCPERFQFGFYHAYEFAHWLRMLFPCKVDGNTVLLITRAHPERICRNAANFRYL
jgi:hypothetical protein